MSNGMKRGDIWMVRFDPSEGDEIQKVRPAVVVTAAGAGRMNLHIVVPITGWQTSFSNYFWLVQIAADTQNGLSKLSGADAFQVKSVSINRFQKKVGVVTDEQLNDISEAISYWRTLLLI
jgi:mRNA interferase MazF